ncbi:hypothetical protein C8F04DRAFT_1176329 [Mycena alexandri]|uniref:Uncharacterized protein n=1 Tax=Mycena alexandri TaxID=1745969 RepID=A0AAD6TAQ1_9AGAR|nr:hypothetical protein C8F04DRAFT_1176329 [Mycena alexandri]
MTYNPTDTVAVIEHLNMLSTKSHILDRMLTLIQLSLNVNSEIHAAALKGEFLAKLELACTYTKADTARMTFCEHVSWGQHFTFLCGADGKWLPMVRHLMLPINYILNCSGFVETLQLQTNVLKPIDRSLKWHGIKYSFDGYAQHSKEWCSSCPLPEWNLITDTGQVDLPSPITIKSPPPP